MRRDLQFAYWFVVIGGIVVSAPIANAETPTQKPDASAKDSGDAPLSKKLDKNKGVIQPPEGVDPGMHQQPPAKTGDKMPVIVPPGEPGGDQSIQPK